MQSAMPVNRTNVTLYGVQPGEMYTVEITPYLLNKKGVPHNFLFRYVLSCPVTVTTACTLTMDKNIPTTNTQPTTNPPAPSVTSK